MRIHYSSVLLERLYCVRTCLSNNKNHRTNNSLRSKRFCAVSEQRMRNKSQRPRENGASKRAGRGWRRKEGKLPLPFPPLSFFGSRFISRAVKTENPVPRSFFIGNYTETLATQATPPTTSNVHISLFLVKCCWRPFEKIKDKTSVYSLTFDGMAWVGQRFIKSYTQSIPLPHLSTTPPPLHPSTIACGEKTIFTAVVSHTVSEGNDDRKIRLMCITKSIFNFFYKV